jgi:hypothetical protein
LSFTELYYYNGQEKINFKQLERDSHCPMEVVSSNFSGRTLPGIGIYNTHFHGKAYIETY